MFTVLDKLLNLLINKFLQQLFFIFDKNSSRAQKHNNKDYCLILVKSVFKYFVQNSDAQGVSVDVLVVIRNRFKGSTVFGAVGLPSRMLQLCYVNQANIQDPQQSWKAGEDHYEQAGVTCVALKRGFFSKVCYEIVVGVEYKVKQEWLDQTQIRVQGEAEQHTCLNINDPYNLHWLCKVRFPLFFP